MKYCIRKNWCIKFKNRI